MTASSHGRNNQLSKYLARSGIKTCHGPTGTNIPIVVGLATTELLEVIVSLTG